jgi:SAM-dependent methyltransferase
MSDREAVRSEWSAGDYAAIGQRLAPAATALVEAAGVQAGMEVLDVATGTGNAALAAAARGARVVGVDLTEELIAVARRRARDEGLAADFLIGDAEDLEFEDGRFDGVLSSFGAIFAPRPPVAVGELARVCSLGGTVAVASWPQDGLAMRFGSALARHLPARGGAGSPPQLAWASEASLSELFDARQMDVRVQRRTDLAWSFADADAAAAFFERSSGALQIALREGEARGTADAIRADLRSVLSDAARPAGDGAVTLPFDYLITVARRR